MADTHTPNYNWVQPEVGASADTWGDKLNANLFDIDAQVKTVSDAAAAAASAAAVLITVPVGAIIMWSGTLASIPAGWHLCDGSGGTPNLSDRFILGAHPARLPGDAGGSFYTAAAGGHWHGGVTGGHTLTLAQIPSHQHQISTQSAMGGGSGYQPVNWNGSTTWNTSPQGGGQAHDHPITAEADHAHIAVPPYYALAFIMCISHP